MMLSVVCPSFNRASFLEACIDPVMSLPEAEFILVDDGSTDGTLELARTLEDCYGKDRIVVISLGGNQGAQVARNRGMERAKGDMILFCDSDDVLDASGLAELVSTVECDPSLDYAYGKVLMTDEKLVRVPDCDPIGEPFEDTPVEFAGYHWHTMGALYKRSYLEKVGPWNPDLTGSQDWEYQARVKMAGGRGRFVDTTVGYWRQHEGGRVGTRKFRPDYVRSVATACDVIISGAREKGVSNRRLQRRVAKKLLLHALECGANGDSQLRKQCLSRASSSIHADFGFSLLIRIMRIFPTWFDAFFWKRLMAR